MQTQKEIWQEFKENHGKTYGIRAARRYEYREKIEQRNGNVAALYGKTAFAIVTADYAETKGAWLLVRENNEIGECLLESIVSMAGGINAIASDEPLVTGENAAKLLDTVKYTTQIDLAHLISTMKFYIQPLES